jgi:beta-lactamase regulating signal transducer with metallopeptidase domain
MTFLSDVVAAWWAWTVPMSLQLALLTLVVLLLDGLLGRRAWPALKSALWWLVLLKVVLPPSLTSPWSLARLGPEVMALRTPPPWTGLPSALFAVWLAGTLLLSATLLWRYRRLRQTTLGSTKAELSPELGQLVRQVAQRLGMKWVPDVRVTTAACGPAVLGFWRPIVLVPVGLLREADREQLEHVLMHEFTHLRRRDPLANLVGLAVQLVAWFHPAVWLARSRLATLREVGCDLAVAALLRDAADEYRRTLLRLAQSLLLQPAPIHLALLRRRSQLLQRLAWLEGPPRDRPALRYPATVALCSVLLVSVVPLARPSLASMVLPEPLLVETSAPVVGPTPALSPSELPGCLPLRYYVHGLLAQAEERKNLAE